MHSPRCSFSVCMHSRAERRAPCGKADLENLDTVNSPLTHDGLRLRGLIF